MKTINYKSYAGDDFSTVAKKSKELAIEKNTNVKFEFNEIICIVSKDTNLEWLLRDYRNSHRMEWKQIGPDCLIEYELEVIDELNRRNKLAKEKEEEQRKKWQEEERKERSVYEEKVKGIEIELKDAEGWKKSVEVNSDPYGKATMEFADAWAKLMQAEITKGKTLIECAENTSHELGFLGITGFMYGCAVSILSECWKHGEELRKWHNKDYGHEGDGVVNPAILTIEKK